ncbi:MULTISPECIES: glycosyltransferase family 2 protein [unclassified Kaistella]|uniref:glycosyltransferase family 2 protein n=1 Tax=unclassified Kaistella TaxID=2762626 RepID=UPI002735689A|nr:MULTISPECIES: glycosyltransferase family 2 protein [unclassified Kaistella]MDP2455198.1 glycosyltransferase family 2 protein [Kaistella sp. SH11-4b]MDP2458172.1 glycosyltransferase family 2 protein [Kaistella sp. SH40-3]MDP2460965.1 glycosyltransferase family 2 protein [Kaistella sp. SH19-2b]
MKKIATIIVTYNGEKWINRCLDSVLKSTYPTDIYVVDNCSNDDTLALIKSYPVNLEVLHFNAGFGYANNSVLQKLMDSDYDYFFLMNQDIYLEENSLKQIVDFSSNHPETGIIAPIQYDGEGQNIDANFQQFINLSIDKKNFYETTFCNAAAWLITKECLQKVGFFNSYFPHYGEDRNYCERAKYHDFKIAIVKETKVLHDRTQKMTPEKALKLAKIKLLTIFLNPNKTKSQSITSGFTNVFGISKYLFKKYSSYTAVFALLKEYFILFKKRNELEFEKNKQK